MVSIFFFFYFQFILTAPVLRNFMLNVITYNFTYMSPFPVWILLSFSEGVNFVFTTMSAHVSRGQSFIIQRTQTFFIVHGLVSKAITVFSGVCSGFLQLLQVSVVFSYFIQSTLVYLVCMYFSSLLFLHCYHYLLRFLYFFSMFLLILLLERQFSKSKNITLIINGFLFNSLITVEVSSLSFYFFSWTSSPIIITVTLSKQ